MTWFTSLPDSVKSWAAALGALALVFSTGGATALALSGYRSIPYRVDAHDRAISELRTQEAEHDRRLYAQERRSEYILCLLESIAGANSITATQCAMRYGRNP